jgi:hypothetical protein
MEANVKWRPQQKERGETGRHEAGRVWRTWTNLKVNKRKDVPVLNCALRHADVWGSGGTF